MCIANTANKPRRIAQSIHAGMLCKPVAYVSIHDAPLSVLPYMVMLPAKCPTKKSNRHTPVSATTILRPIDDVTNLQTVVMISFISAVLSCTISLHPLTAFCKTESVCKRRKFSKVPRITYNQTPKLRYLRTPAGTLRGVLREGVVQWLSAKRCFTLAASSANLCP